jgi:hypothetical protein
MKRNSNGWIRFQPNERTLSLPEMLTAIPMMDKEITVEIDLKGEQNAR